LRVRQPGLEKPVQMMPRVSQSQHHWVETRLKAQGPLKVRPLRILEAQGTQTTVRILPAAHD